MLLIGFARITPVSIVGRDAACSETAFPLTAMGTAVPIPRLGALPQTPPGTSPWTLLRFALFSAILRDYALAKTPRSPFTIERAGTTPRTQESGYTCVSRPMTVPGLSTLLQPISAKSPSIAPNFLRPVS